MTKSKREIYLRQTIKITVAKYLAWPVIFPVLLFLLLGAAVSPWLFFGTALCVIPVIQMLAEIKPYKKELAEIKNAPPETKEEKINAEE